MPILTSGGRTASIVFCSIFWPRAVTAHRQRMRGTHRTPLIQRLQDRFDKAVAGIAGQAFAVGAEVRQFAAAVPDRHGQLPSTLSSLKTITVLPGSEQIPASPGGR